MKTIAIRCTAAVNLHLSELTPLQGGLKELSDGNSEKLKRSMLKHGITFPFFIWQNEGENYILDGTQRRLSLLFTVQECWCFGTKKHSESYSPGYSTHGLRVGKLLCAVKNWLARTTEAHHVVPAGKDRQAVCGLVIAAAKLE